MQVRIPGPHPPGLTLFETMRAEADGRIALWPRHRARFVRGAAALGWRLDMDRAEGLLRDLPRGGVLRARLALHADGGLSLTHAPLPPDTPLWRVAIASVRLDARDPWLAIKSSHRPAYDAARAALSPGEDEALLLNRDGLPCEGSITSIFLERGDRLLTPPLSQGLLPGILRESLLESGRAVEAPVRLAALREGRFFCGNALRGLIPAQLVIK